MGLFGGVIPSVGRGLRVSKILRSEWLRQARLYGQALHLHALGKESTAATKMKSCELSSLVGRNVEFISHQTLSYLRAITPRKSAATSDQVHILGDVVLPHNVKRIFGPKWHFRRRHTSSSPWSGKPRVGPLILNVIDVLLKAGRCFRDVSLRTKLSILKPLLRT
ncbi:hypothetical protein HPB50_018605 [Hyalomma asiaticum]|uniref:Uncharacterized protein n=1 Tax=Hyalomma asiaticum TaxID=266040 RepID=A0ACB7SGM5_HYAAI|nr:hypothetical protein HPB50_018605 [Hyalomma asiaticum]